MSLWQNFRSRSAAWAMLCAAGSVAALGGCAPRAPSAKESAAPVVAVTPTVPGVDFAKVKGRWLRMDGGYVLAINSVDAEGRADAAYFNPNPIKVAWGKVTTEAAMLKVNVELRDVNYPGCLYKLSYVPATDRLVGTYFQAQQQQTYDVEFAREAAR